MLQWFSKLWESINFIAFIYSISPFIITSRHSHSVIILYLCVWHDLQGAAIDILLFFQTVADNIISWLHVVTEQMKIKAAVEHHNSSTVIRYWTLSLVIKAANSAPSESITFMAQNKCCHVLPAVENKGIPIVDRSCTKKISEIISDVRAQKWEPSIVLPDPSWAMDLSATCRPKAS